MTKETSEITEVAKAVQEASQATSKAIETAKKFGQFLNTIFGDTLRNSVGIMNDNISEYRKRNLIRLRIKTEEYIAQAGIDQIKPIPMKTAIPLIENATIEDSDELMDIWAQLLANSLNPDHKEKADKGLITLLAELEAPEIGLLFVLDYASDTNVSDTRTTQLEALKNKHWRHYDTNRQKQAIHTLVRLKLAQFEVNNFDKIRNHFSNISSQKLMTDISINHNKMIELINELQFEFSISRGSLEPMTFQYFNDDNEPDRYTNPENGMHLIYTGARLVRACTSQTQKP